MRGTPRYSECAAWPGTRVPRRLVKATPYTPAGQACRAFSAVLLANGTCKVATRSAKRTCTPDAWRSEVSRTATRLVCSSGQARNVTWGAPGNNTRIRAAAHNKSGRRTPPHCARYLARRAPAPRWYSNSGGSQGWGVRGELGRRGGAGLLPECATGDVPGWPACRQTGRCGWRCEWESQCFRPCACLPVRTRRQVVVAVSVVCAGRGLRGHGRVIVVV